MATDVTLVIGDETFAGCLQTLDWTALEPDVVEYKFHAPGIGLVREHRVGKPGNANELTGSSLW